MCFPREIRGALGSSRFDSTEHSQRTDSLGVYDPPANVPRVIANDPDDDHVLACALAAQADLIVSGDKHLHSLGGHYQGIRIVDAAMAMEIISAQQV